MFHDPVDFEGEKMLEGFHLFTCLFVCVYHTAHIRSGTHTDETQLIFTVRKHTFEYYFTLCGLFQTCTWLNNVVRILLQSRLNKTPELLFL